MSDALRLAWLVDIELDGDPQRYDIVVDAASGEVLPGGTRSSTLQARDACCNRRQ